MPQPPRLRPFHKRYVHRDLGLHPAALLHRLSVQAFSPPPFAGFREIHKRTLLLRQRLDDAHHGAACGRYEPGPKTADKPQLTPLALAQDDFVETMTAGHIPANHKPAREFSLALDPGSAALP